MKKPKEAKTEQKPLLRAGTYDAVVSQVTDQFKPGTTEPLTVTVEYALTGRNQTVARVYPPSIEGRSPLLRDSRVLLDRELTAQEYAGNFDTAILVGCSCQVYVVHRPDKDGLLKEFPKEVMPPVIPVVEVAAVAVAA